MDNYQESLSWLQSARKAGMPDVEVRNQLASSGWQPQQIEELFGLASVKDSVTGAGVHELIKAKKKPKTLLFIVLAIIFLAAAGFAAYWFFIKEDAQKVPVIRNDANTSQPQANQNKNVNLNVNNNLNNNKNSSSSNSNSAVNLPLSETTYSNDVYEVDYPSSLVRYSLSDLIGQDFGEWETYILALTNSDECFTWFKGISDQVDMGTIKEGCTFITVYVDDEQTLQSDIDGYLEDGGVQTKNENITIADKQGKKVVIQIEKNNHVEIYASVFNPFNTNDSTGGVIFEAITTPQGQQQAEDMIDAMTSTLRAAHSLP